MFGGEAGGGNALAVSLDGEPARRRGAPARRARARAQRDRVRRRRRETGRVQDLHPGRGAAVRGPPARRGGLAARRRRAPSARRRGARAPRGRAGLRRRAPGVGAGVSAGPSWARPRRSRPWSRPPPAWRPTGRGPGRESSARVCSRCDLGIEEDEATGAAAVVLASAAGPAAGDPPGRGLGHPRRARAPTAWWRSAAASGDRRPGPPAGLAGRRRDRPPVLLLRRGGVRPVGGDRQARLAAGQHGLPRGLAAQAPRLGGGRGRRLGRAPDPARRPGRALERGAPGAGLGRRRSRRHRPGLLGRLRGVPRCAPWPALEGVELAEAACRLEIDLLGRTVGKQDQYAAVLRRA